MSIFKRAPKEPKTPVSRELPRSSLLLGATTHSYEKLYREQPAVRTVVDFVARNVAQVPVHGYQREGGGRTRLPNSNSVERFIRRPNPETGTYAWVFQIMADLAVFGNYYAVKVRGPKGLLAVVRIPPILVSYGTDSITDGPAKYHVRFSYDTVSYDEDEMFHIRLYNPHTGKAGVSPLEACRAMLSEDAASTTARERFWKNGAQYSDVFERPTEAGDWSDKARERFIEQIKMRYSLQNDASGMPLVLEEGIKRTGDGQSPRDAEYVAGRTLTLGFVGGVYGIPPQLIGASATDRNWSEAHRALYQDLLPPWTRLLEDEFDRQLVPELVGSEQSVDGRIFTEFSLDEKLRGGFMQEAEVFSSAVGGGAWMTVNEIRRLKNLPPISGGDSLAVPSPQV